MRADRPVDCAPGGAHPQVPQHAWPADLDGGSLADLLTARSPGAAAGRAESTPARPPYVVSQFHGDNLAASWFMIVEQIGGATYKLIHWGTGQEGPSLLYTPGVPPKYFPGTSPSTNPSTVVLPCRYRLSSTARGTTLALTLVLTLVLPCGCCCPTSAAAGATRILP